MIELTKKEAITIAELIEMDIFKIIREDPTIDSIDWLKMIVDIYTKCKEGGNDKGKDTTGDGQAV